MPAPQSNASADGRGAGDQRKRYCRDREIRYGDNDRLAARVAQMISADTLVLLSDVDGLYDADPRTSDTAVLIPEVNDITPEIKAMAGAAPAGYSSGGW